ncbi:FAD-dependent oxidoreductase [Prosthecomicrobium pneumaticum]|uniref:Salicylate hydroxylase n=1 Tax=Prosthecomicrobium pneumaticum TaxID=81895 RepID=A0A7W9FLZ5_9HYPH|nr:NAD(P)/FAD-dependent oxidoreductase [Prosthecomicrobium pneumaticum]MBB5753071.1 salicylate hydroxylase [Prosthecomicrobium pneumaticum]
MTRSGRPRIVVAGAGIAGSLIADALGADPRVEILCLERAQAVDHAEAGTGLNIGPNAIACLAAHMPERAAAIVRASLPWRRWTIALTDGAPLFDLDLSDVADHAGIRIRWAELYQLLRVPLGHRVIYGAELVCAGPGRDGRPMLAWRDRCRSDVETMSGIDLLIGADGRYSRVRTGFFGEDAPRFLGVCLYRLLFPVGEDCPIDDYGQWFNGPNRLLAYRVPGGFVYCAGSFPIPPDAPVPEAMKRPEALRAAYTPQSGSLSAEAGFLVAAIERHTDEIHWARLQDGTIHFGAAGVLLVGDAAHPMVPTLGQGATQAVEDACVAVEEIRAALDTGRPLAEVPARVAARRAARVRFVVDFSREATDTMLAGADPRAGTLKKRERPFMEKLERLYRDVPLPA